jgi:integrase/recombinase XerD
LNSQQRVRPGLHPLSRAASREFWTSARERLLRSSLKAIRFLIRFAISQGELAHDPIEDVEVLKADGPKSTGHMTWLQPQIAQYRKRHTLGTVARLALELLLNIAARRHDVHVIGQQHVRDGKLSWRPHKTLRSTGKLLTIRIIPELQAALDARPKEPGTIAC